MLYKCGHCAEKEGLVIFIRPTVLEILSFLTCFLKNNVQSQFFGLGRVFFSRLDENFYVKRLRPPFNAYPYPGVRIFAKFTDLTPG